MFSNRKKEQNSLKKIKKKLKKELSPKRYIHSEGVSYTAAALAMCYGENIEDALVAGMLHDCAKSFSNEELIAFCKKFGLTPTPQERSHASLLHSKVGSSIAAQKYGIENQNILDSITYHTTGRPDMSLFEKIIFVADFIEPSRDKVPNLNEIRKIAFTNIDECIVKVCEATISYLESNNIEIDEATINTLNFYKTNN